MSPGSHDTRQPRGSTANGQLHTTFATTADGRTIIYYDSQPVIRTHVDDRNLASFTAESEMRHDPILDEWVLISAQRQSRTFMPAVSRCPLCPTTNGNATEIPAPDYEVVVFENRFPSLALTADDLDPGARVSKLVERRPALGRCEVVVFTSDHSRRFAELNHDRARMVIDVLADRTAALSALPDISQVFAFENSGAEIGVTLTHPHGQVYAYPFVTPRTERMLRSAARYRDECGANLFADVLAEERRIGDRVVDENATWTAFVPSAARWPIDIHIYPHRQIPDLTHLTDQERSDFTDLYLRLLVRLDALYDDPLPYVAGWHQAPTHRDRDLAYLHLELLSVRRAPDKLKYLAGSESGMEVWINDATPERIAEMVRGNGR